MLPILAPLLCAGVLAVLPMTGAAAELTVSAAASLGNALRAVTPLFEAANPGTAVQFNLAASGALLQQIAKGAPVDVFVSADALTMDQAQSQALVSADRRRNIVSNTLVLVVPVPAVGAPPAAPEPAALADLAQPRYRRVAIGLPASVPAGRYAQDALQAAGLWNTLQPRLIYAQNVRQALDYVARGEVDAGFVYATDAALLPGKVKVAFELRAPILYPAAPVSASRHPDAAQAFVDFLLTAPAQAVFAAHGFGRP